MTDSEDIDTGTDVSDVSDTGTDVSDVESTGSSSKPQGMVKHRTNSSLGNHMDLVNRMVSRWGSVGDGEFDGAGELLRENTEEFGTDSDYEQNAENNPNGDDKATKKPVSKPGHRRKKSATDEMKLLKMEKEALESAFDKYIDPDLNGDVDVDEWFMGIQKLNVQLNEMQQKKIYNFMDKEESGFIEKDDFVTFAMAKFDNAELQELQKPILEAVRLQNLHNRTHSNLMNPVLSQDWSDYDMSLVHQEMFDHMHGMVEVMQESVTQEHEFEQMVIERAEKNPDMLQPENAFKWTKYEVSHWITNMGMDRYSRYFAQESVDGPMLLEDMTEEMLSTNLGVRSIHAKKIMREIYTLKKAVRGVTDLILDQSDFVCTHSIDDIEKKIATLRIKEELEKTRRQKEQLKKFYENEMTKLNKVIIELKENQSKHGKKKKKKKKDKEKDTKKEDVIVLPQPPMDFDQSTSAESMISPQFGLGVLPPLNDANDTNDEDMKDDIKENELETENDNDSADDSKPAQTQEIEQYVKPGSDSEDASSEDSESESESDDEAYVGRGKRLLGMSQSHLMALRNRKNGVSPKQINKFIRDLSKKKQSLGDRFCVIDMDTIEEWSKLEVAYWIISIGFEQYAFSFYALPIDGDMLIRDMNKEAIIEDLGVMKIHSARILRQIDKLRKIINEGFDEDVVDGVHIEPDLERPSMATIESLQERIETLQSERDDIMQELEAKHDDDDEESGYFSKKIQELETERDALLESSDAVTAQMEEIKSSHVEQIENLNNTLNEANVSNDGLRKEVKAMKKEVRKAKRAGFDAEDMEEDESESEEEEEVKQVEDEMEEVEIIHNIEAIEGEIEKEMEENNAFGFEEKVLEWSPAEVCQWLKNIQYAPYIEVFYNAQIFGDVLIQDIGTRMLTKFKVKAMHISKLLRQIGNLRKTVVEKGVRIELSEEIKMEMFPERYKKEKEKKKSGGNKVGMKKYKELEVVLLEKEGKLQELERRNGEKEEQIQEWEQQFDEEKQVRIAVELELDHLKQEYEGLLKSGSKQQIERLENLISNIEESKIRTVRDLNDQLNSLRIGCRLMQKEIAYLKTKQGFHPIESLVESLGYSAPPKY